MSEVWGRTTGEEKRLEGGPQHKQGLHLCVCVCEGEGEKEVEREDVKKDKLHVH